MVSGGEARFLEIILDGMVKHWVGFGWIDMREATKEDYLKIREVK
jgi:hypothetical protein